MGTRLQNQLQDHVEVPSEARQELNNNDNVHTSAAKNTSHSQGVMELQKQPEWAMKASSIVQNVVEKLSALDWRAGKKHMKLVLFMLVAVAIVSVQVIKSLIMVKFLLMILLELLLRYSSNTLGCLGSWSAVAVLAVGSTGWNYRHTLVVSKCETCTRCIQQL
ncbi:hypothetical protein M758_9G067100 [Ceratodon purpureus]|nr:hypothetical protein M758_9G067100 [Ceratodon purpureus]